MTTRELLMRAYELMGRAVAPRVRYSQEVYEEVLLAHAARATAWLDLGCGRRILPLWRGEAERTLVRACPQVVGVDIDYDAIAQNRSLSLKCLASATTLPFAEATFDLVTANMVVEHLDDPATQFREVARVLKRGGLFIMHTPNALGYPTLLARLVPGAVKKRLAYYLDGRAEEDVYPTFYRANSRKALESLARESALTIVEPRFIVNSALFALVLPIAFFELIWLRVLMSGPLERFRTNIIVVLQKGAPPHDVVGQRP